ncbi:hypothetical protein Tco_1409722 [Tanacetum coccineum]
MESDEFIKSSVEILVPIPSESEGVPEMCDVPFHDNSPPMCDVPRCEDTHPLIMLSMRTFLRIIQSNDDKSFQ